MAMGRKGRSFIMIPPPIEAFLLGMGPIEWQNCGCSPIRRRWNPTGTEKPARIQLFLRRHRGRTPNGRGKVCQRPPARHTTD
jgi:hypothetical protein